MKKILITILASASALAFLPSSFKTEYVQEFKSKVDKGTRRAAGVFEYKYPSNLRLDQKMPEKLLYVSNSKTTWIYRAPFFEDEAPEVTIHKGQETGLSNFFDLLKAGLKTNGNYQVTSKKNSSFIKFNKNAVKKTGVKEATLNFLGKKKVFSKLKNISIKYEDGRDVKLELKNTKVDVKFKKKYFHFDIPKKAKVVRQ
jgi:outer membrane lipoprotein-sorting protein